MFFVDDDDVEIAATVMCWNRMCGISRNVSRISIIFMVLVLSLSSKWTFISPVMVTGSENATIHSSNDINSLKSVSDSSIDPSR